MDGDTKHRDKPEIILIKKDNEQNKSIIYGAVIAVAMLIQIRHICWESPVVPKGSVNFHHNLFR